MTQAVALAQQASTGVSQGFKNRIINGAMVIDQRNAGASVGTGGSSPTYTVDRYRLDYTQTSKMTAQQSSTAPVGFVNSLKITSSSAYSIVASDYFVLQQAIEGYNTSDLGWGTANAKTITLSFWVNSSLTGTFGGNVRNSDNSRCYPFSYTISSANTWEQKSITIAGDTSGTWLTTNGVGIFVTWGLGVGSTYSGTAGSWGSTLYLSATGATSVVGTNGATFYITGVQLEVGSTATSFDTRSYGTELALCQRYFQKSYGITVTPGTNTLAGIRTTGGTQAAATTGYIEGDIVFRPPMRTAPSITFYDQTGASGKCTRLLTGTGRTNNQNIDVGITADSGTPIYSTGTANGSNIQVHYAANAEL